MQNVSSDSSSGSFNSAFDLLSQWADIMFADTIEPLGPATVYKTSVTLWLMIFQRLNSGGSLSLAVEELRNGTSTNFLRSASRSNQARKLAVSPATGGYARGRERMSVEVVGAVADRINGDCNGNCVSG